ncbi:MAG: nuclear transport factor 2 family protein [Pseudomonadota bacterium]
MSSFIKSLALAAATSTALISSAVAQDVSPTSDAADHHAVTDALIRFTNGMDTDNGALIASAFAEAGIADFTPAAACVGMQFPVLEGRENIVSVLVPFASGFTTSHSVTNARAEVDGDTATLYALVEAQHLPEGDGSRNFMMMNQYRIDLIREGDQWVMSRMTIDNLWSDGDLAVMTAG